MLSRIGEVRYFLLFAISVLVIPGLLQAAGQRQNPWSYPGNDQVPEGNRPWGNIPPAQDYRQYGRQNNRQNNSWREPPVDQQHYQPGYPYQGYSGTPYQGYMGSPNTDPYQGYSGTPYQGYMGSPYTDPYQGYSGTPYLGSPYTDPYSGYGSPYNPSLLPGFGSMHGIYPGLEGGSLSPGTMFPYPGW